MSLKIGNPDVSTDAAAGAAPPADTSAAPVGPRGRDERRGYTGPDRRKPSLKSFIYGAFNPRRRRVRREEDMDHTFLDWHPRRLLVICSIILSLSVLDGLLTVHLAANGIKEINPLMAAFISSDPVLFALAKIGLTAVGVTGLVLTGHMRIYSLVRASTVLYFFLAVYVLLVFYQAIYAQIMT
ncbi:MAG TPA: DUF5658 family protein [Gammaproteobacteria bacterium]